MCNRIKLGMIKDDELLVLVVRLGHRSDVYEKS